MSRTRTEVTDGPVHVPELDSEAPRKSTFRKFKDRLKRAPSRADLKPVEQETPPPTSRPNEVGKLGGPNTESKTRRKPTLQPVAEGVQLQEEEHELQPQPQRRTRSRSFSFLTRHLSKSKKDSSLETQMEAPVRPSTSPKHSTEDVKEHVAAAGKPSRTKSPPLPEHAREQVAKFSYETSRPAGNANWREHTKPPSAHQNVFTRRQSEEGKVPSIPAQPKPISRHGEDSSATQKPSAPVEPIIPLERLQTPQPQSKPETKAEITPPKSAKASPTSPNHTSRFTEEGLLEYKPAVIPNLVDASKHDSATFSTADTEKTEPTLSHSREISDSSVHPSTAATSSRDSREHTENEDYQRFIDEERIRLDKVAAYEGKIFSDAVAEAAERATKKRELEAKQQKGLRRNKSVKETLKREMSLSQKSTLSRTLSKSSRAIGNYIRPAPTPEGLERIGDQIIDSEGKLVVLTNDGPMVVPSRSDTRGSKTSRKMEPTLEQKRGHRRGGSKDMPISPVLVEDEN